MHTLFLKRRDLAAVTAINDADLRVGVDLSHEAHAPRAENAAVAVEHQRWTEIHVGTDTFAIEHAPWKFHPAFVWPEAVSEVLERAFAALIADRTIEGVIDEQELEHAGPRLDDVRCLSRDDHAFGDRRGAGRLQLRHLFNLDDADAAGAVDAQARVIAVIRDLDSAFDGGLQYGLPLLGRNRPSINRQRDGFHSPRSYLSFPERQRSTSTSAPLSALAAIVRTGPFSGIVRSVCLSASTTRMFSLSPELYVTVTVIGTSTGSACCSNRIVASAPVTW